MAGLLSRGEPVAPTLYNCAISAALQGAGAPLVVIPACLEIPIWLTAPTLASLASLAAAAPAAQSAAQGAGGAGAA